MVTDFKKDVAFYKKMSEVYRLAAVAFKENMEQERKKQEELEKQESALKAGQSLITDELFHTSSNPKVAASNVHSMTIEPKSGKGSSIRPKSHHPHQMTLKNKDQTVAAKPNTIRLASDSRSNFSQSINSSKVNLNQKITSSGNPVSATL